MTSSIRQGAGRVPGEWQAKVEWRQKELFPRVGFVVSNLSLKPDEGAVDFCSRRSTAEQWIKEGKYAVNWTRLSCHRFIFNQVRLQLFILAYNLGNFLGRLCLPRAIRDWSLPSLQLKLIKLEGRIVRHARKIIFQLAQGGSVQGPIRCYSGANNQAISLTRLGTS